MLSCTLSPQYSVISPVWCLTPAHFPLLVCNSPAHSWRSHLLLAFCLPSCSALSLEGPFSWTRVPGMTSMCESAAVAMAPARIFLLENCSVQGHCRKLLVIYLGRSEEQFVLGFGICLFVWKVKSSECELPCENSMVWGLSFQEPSV